MSFGIISVACITISTPVVGVGVGVGVGEGSADYKRRNRDRKKGVVQSCGPKTFVADTRQFLMDLSDLSESFRSAPASFLFVNAFLN
jgi:hypothetical protein